MCVKGVRGGIVCVRVCYVRVSLPMSHIPHIRTGPGLSPIHLSPDIPWVKSHWRRLRLAIVERRDEPEHQ